MELFLFERVFIKETHENNLNISYNWLRRNESVDFILSLMKIINSTIVHLDISHNNLTVKAWKNLGDLIESNHSLYGIHIHGNDWYVDGFGFIKTGFENYSIEYSK